MVVSTNSDISDEARPHVPRNFSLIAISHALSNLGDHLANPKTVLAWLLGSVGAPAALVSLLVPIRESGSMVLQVFVAGLLRRLPRRKVAWVAGAALQALAVLGMGAVAVVATGAMAGWLILLLLAVFSLSRGLSSVASKDVLGKTIPKGRRGRVSGLGSTASGVAAAILGAYVWSVHGGDASARFCAELLVTASLLWIVAGFVYANVRELAGETKRRGNGVAETLRRLALLKSDGHFRKFVLSRALLLCSALSAPYYVVLAQQQHGVDLRTLGSFILANALASSVSATFWGLMADVSSRRVLLRAGTLTAVLGFGVAAAAAFDTPLGDSRWTYPVAFFVLGIAHNGVRLGRKTYVVDMAGGDRRTEYVAVSNTVIGIILLLCGLLTPLASVIAPAGMILFLSVCGLIGVAVAATLPEVE